MALFTFLGSFGSLEATYDDGLRLIGKRVWTWYWYLLTFFRYRCYGLRRYTSEYRLKIGDFAPAGAI